MRNTTKGGRSRGEIVLEVLIEDEYEDIFNKLKEVLIITGKITDNDSDEWLDWLLETVKKTDIFEGIYMKIDRENGCLVWYIE
jgi:hypothetical protein